MIFLRPLTLERPLLNFELDILNSEIDRLNEVVDLCGDDDDDVLENCDIELKRIIEYLEGSIKITRFLERGLKVVS